MSGSPRTRSTQMGRWFQWTIILSLLLFLRFFAHIPCLFRNKGVDLSISNQKVVSAEETTLYNHFIPRTIHQIWFKNISHEKVKSEPIELKQSCLDVNCVGSPGGWTAKQWSEEEIMNLTTWPLIHHLWEKGDLNNPRMMSDIARLAILWEYGGAYLDSDIACYKPFDILLESSALHGATMVGCQENDGPKVDGLFTNCIVFTIPRHPFIGWMLSALQKNSLTGEDWVVTGPVAWGQEIENFARAHPELMGEIRILQSSVLCPMGVFGALPDNFNIDSVWSMNYFPSTSLVPFMETFHALKRDAMVPKCETLHDWKRIDEALEYHQRLEIRQNLPTTEQLVPITKIRKTPSGS